jgi:hypothetical protein
MPFEGIHNISPETFFQMYGTVFLQNVDSTALLPRKPTTKN